MTKTKAEKKAIPERTKNVFVMLSTSVVTLTIALAMLINSPDRTASNTPFKL